MPYITLNTAVSITGRSKRTLWRRIAEGQLHAQGGGDQGDHARVLIDEVMTISRLKLPPEDFALVLDADAAQAEAQCDLALEFLIQGLSSEAVRWLTLAAHRDYPEAMHQLGRCYIAGNGLEPNEALGIEWISRAAALGHITAKRMTQYLMDPARAPLPPAELETTLDAIEQKVVLSVLNQSADPV